MMIRPLKPVFRFITRPFRRVKVFLKQRAGWLGMPKILPYRGYGNLEEVFIMGSVVEDKGLVKPQEWTKIWQNVLATIKRFSSDEIPGVRVRATFHGITGETVTDEYGFFSFHFKMGNRLAGQADEDWHKVTFELLDQVVEDQPQTSATGEILVIRPDTKRIIVSDIDDTVLVSHSTQTLRKLRLMLFKNARTRTPFPGVPEFYKALKEGAYRSSRHPFFYVSSSEWNLYDLLDDFFAFNDIPRGVFLLRKLTYSIFKFWKSGQGNHEHKYEKIKSLLEFFSEQRFILIGDSGQRDPEIYKRLATEYPGRIESIYIRKVGSKPYFTNIQKIQTTLQEISTDYLQVEDTSDAVKHASEKGYIIRNS
jgi:phosphatidate phosphatase APP1